MLHMMLPLRATRAYIDLDALRYNLRILKDLVPSAEPAPPIVGRVSMDMITVDLTELQPTPNLYDEVFLIGESDNGASVSAEEIAEIIGTIPYEVTCDHTPRIPRVYRGNGKDVAVRTMREGYQLL